MNDSDWRIRKRLTGIDGLDRLTRGGLPSGQATLVLGQPGAGKTILGLQILAHAIEQGHGGLFITFEETIDQIRRDAASFSWGQALNESASWRVINARPQSSSEMAGDFDLEGLLAAISHEAGRLDEPWIIIDGIDQILQHKTNEAVAVDQIRQLNERCEAEGWTLLLSGKVDDHQATPRSLTGIEYMLPTTLLLTTTLDQDHLRRHLRIAKYRGSAHGTGQVPLIIDDAGLHLPYQLSLEPPAIEAGNERVSTGIQRLDRVVGGGLYRGSSTLVSGRPGTAKSTLAASFADAASKRGENTLYISFDELQGPYVRNLASVGIDLQTHIDSGRLRFSALTASAVTLPEHVFAIKRLVDDFAPACLVIDPVSALLKAAGHDEARLACEQLLELARAREITTFMTSLANEQDPEGETSLAHVSTIADTWIVLDYNVRGGERNRSLSVVKSRGSAHSNQQRELILSNTGIDLADPYEYGTEVLMGTARAHKEYEEHLAARRAALKQEARRQDLERRIEQASSEIQRLKTELRIEEDQREELERLDRTNRTAVKRIRRSDTNEGSEGETR